MIRVNLDINVFLVDFLWYRKQKMGTAVNSTHIDTIILHPKSKEEASLYEQLAKSLNTPYEISKEHKNIKKKKPSDFFGTLSLTEGRALEDYVNKSREEWNRDIS